MHELDSVSLGENILNTCSDESCRVFHMRDDNGEGVMTMHRIIDGVYLMFNDFHMSSGHSQLKIDSDIFCLDHCREGRIEQQLNTGTYSYLRAGDLRIDKRSSQYTDFSMPLSHYHGVTIAFFIETVSHSIEKAFPGFPVSLNALSKKYCANPDSFVIRSEPRIEHILSEIYAVPQKIKNYYYQIKVFELLLCLDALELSAHDQSRPYFYKTQVEKVKAIRNLITENIEEHFTLEILSERFEIPLTSMKNCFKGVYGTSIYAYMRSNRMNRAAVLLRTTDYSIARIAGDVGYSNPSKFAAAFKALMGKPPLEYRKSLV